MDPTSFRKKYRDFLSKAGLKRFTIHALRHTFATSAWELGVPIKTVGQILGMPQFRLRWTHTRMYCLNIRVKL